MKKLSLSYVQGRLSKKVGDKFQYFPIDNWQNEFYLANKIGFKNIEWIVSDLSNPILNHYSSLEIRKILKKNKINISSLSLDLIMDKPLHLWAKANLEWLMKILDIASKTHGIKRINVPCEEQSRFFNHENLLKFKKNLKLILKILNNKTCVSLESDFSPKNINHLLKSIKSKNLGINLDLGNIEANGYEIKDFFNLLSKKIFGIHIKERKILFGSTKKLSVNNNIKFLFSNIERLPNLRDLTLQTYRSKNNYVKELKNNYKLIKNLIKNYD
tara:strand:+ start:3524 stop:4339 length:816 start_codon:yes stop_codon:yes gene_type:complete